MKTASGPKPAVARLRCVVAQHAGALLTRRLHGGSCYAGQGGAGRQPRNPVVTTPVKKMARWASPRRVTARELGMQRQQWEAATDVLEARRCANRSGSMQK
jgi:hypothetical protein